MSGSDIAYDWCVRRFRLGDEQGFSLVETLIASAILVTTLSSLAELVVWSARSASASGERSLALVAAQDLLEQLRALAWTVEPDGRPATDEALAISSMDALDADTDGDVDFLDAGGRSVADGVRFVRRWAITAVEGSGPEAIAIHVCVFRSPAPVGCESALACVATIRVRQP